MRVRVCVCVCVCARGCACACACQGGTKWLGHNRKTVLVNEDYSSASCYRCFMVYGDIQRMEAVPKQHDKRCPLCGTRPRDINAGAWIWQFGVYRKEHGRAHPVQEVAEQEAHTRIANAKRAAGRRERAVARVSKKRAGAGDGVGAGGAPAPEAAAVDPAPARSPPVKRQRAPAPAQQQ